MPEKGELGIVIDEKIWLAGGVSLISTVLLEPTNVFFEKSKSLWIFVRKKVIFSDMTINVAVGFWILKWS